MGHAKLFQRHSWGYILSRKGVLGEKKKRLRTSALISHTENHFLTLCAASTRPATLWKKHRNTNELLTQSVFVVRVHVCVSSHPLAWSDPCSCEMFLSYVKLHIWMGRGRARWVQLTSGSRQDNGGRASIGRTKQRPPGSWPLRWEGLGYGIW